MQKVIDLSRILSTEEATWVYKLLTWIIELRKEKKWHSTNYDTVLWNANISHDFPIKLFYFIVHQVFGIYIYYSKSMRSVEDFYIFICQHKIYRAYTPVYLIDIPNIIFHFQSIFFPTHRIYIFLAIEHACV